MFLKLAENRLQDVYSSQVWFAQPEENTKSQIFLNTLDLSLTFYEL